MPVLNDVTARCLRDLEDCGQAPNAQVLGMTRWKLLMHFSHVLDIAISEPRFVMILPDSITTLVDREQPARNRV